MDLNEVICPCLNITTGMIKEAVNEGASTLDEVMEATGAGTICGACVDEVQRITDYFATEKAK